ncbi:MAG: hypothetical protein R2838_13120 [Caldilineaceae bacterium]
MRSHVWRNGPAEQLTDTVAQPALLAASVAVMRAVEAETRSPGQSCPGRNGGEHGGRHDG